LFHRGQKIMSLTAKRENIGKGGRTRAGIGKARKTGLTKAQKRGGLKIPQWKNQGAKDSTERK